MPRVVEHPASKTVSVSDLKTHLSAYLREVKAGVVLVITRYGVPIVTISAIPAPKTRAEDRA